MFAKYNLTKLLPVYLGLFFLMAAIHFLILSLQLDIKLSLAVAESLVFNTILGILGIGLWFLVKFSDFESVNRQEIIIRHLTISAVTLLIWFGSGYYIMGFISGNDAVYMTQMNQTIVVRLIAGILLYIILVVVFYLVINYQNLAERRVREESLQVLLHESELNSLRAQIKPHFLFNALNSISSLTITNPAKAQEMVINLSDFMRYSLSFTNERFSALKQELHHIRLYLEIEKVRFGNRLVVEEIIQDEADQWPLPPMILQPLVENSVKHGIYDTPGESSVRIEVFIDGQRLIVSISNNYDQSASGKNGTGTGLSNVIKRLRMIYGISDLVQVIKNNGIFEVKLSIPQYGKSKGTDH